MPLLFVDKRPHKTHKNFLIFPDSSGKNTTILTPNAINRVLGSNSNHNPVEGAPSQIAVNVSTATSKNTPDAPKINEYAPQRIIPQIECPFLFVIIMLFFWSYCIHDYTELMNKSQVKISQVRTKNHTRDCFFMVYMYLHDQVQIIIRNLCNPFYTFPLSLWCNIFVTFVSSLISTTGNPHSPIECSKSQERFVSWITTNS